MLITKADDRSVAAHIIIGVILVVLAALGSYTVSHSATAQNHSLTRVQ